LGDGLASGFPTGLKWFEVIVLAPSSGGERFGWLGQSYFQDHDDGTAIMRIQKLLFWYY